MKKLLVILLSIITFNSYSQDGMCAYSYKDSVDIFISIYNSDVNNRNMLCEFIYERIADETVRSKTYVILNTTNDTIVGDLFIVENYSYVLYNLYIDYIIYENGTIYNNKRFAKPEPLDDGY